MPGGSDGKLTDFGIRYTFGFNPLQQYLVKLLGGRLQALSIAWDSPGPGRATLVSLKRTVVPAPEETQFRYVHAEALFSTGRTREARAVVEAGLKRRPGVRSRPCEPGGRRNHLSHELVMPLRGPNPGFPYRL